MFGFDVGNVNLFSNNGENSIKHQLRRFLFKMWGRGEGSFIEATQQYTFTHLVITRGLFFLSAPKNNASD